MALLPSRKGREQKVYPHTKKRTAPYLNQKTQAKHSCKAGYVLDPTDHTDAMVNIVSGKIVPSSVTFDNAIKMGKVQMVHFEEDWPL